jgi:HD-GYP domain-containing protein (c-di-GMP phosphodiesterase class II)
MVCDHSVPHSGVSRYVRETGQLRLVLVCDGCGLERAELATLDYRPNGRPNIGQLAELTARELGFDDAHSARVRLAAIVCDAGRSQIKHLDEAILNEEQWIEIQRQPELGAALLSEAFADLREWILCHRERPDGGGYPRGLKDEEIPLEARILAVTSAYDAITSDRPHRSARRHEDACHELRRCAGTQFDATVVEAFLRAALRPEPDLAPAFA